MGDDDGSDGGSDGSDGGDGGKGYEKVEGNARLPRYSYILWYTPPDDGSFVELDYRAKKRSEAREIGFGYRGTSSPCRTAPHRTAPHRTVPYLTAQHRSVERSASTNRARAR
ncbi:hypothetical protein V1478_000530 [Vespula squamosa]|uniref:Uncharacterized protein n=1 Tax=Vespula squamosa TaxID=30214 RepID=A0ABD2C5V9_VESSQ